MWNRRVGVPSDSMHPMAASASAVWLNGGLVDPDQAMVSAFDRGLTVGDGVFETLKVTGGRPSRCAATSRAAPVGPGLGLDVPLVESSLRRVIDEVVAASGLAWPGCASH